MAASADARAAALRDFSQHFHSSARRTPRDLRCEDTRRLQHDCIARAWRTNSSIVFPANGFSRKPSGPPACARLRMVCSGKRRDEDDWYAAASGDQAILKVKAAHTRHLHVGDQTGAVVDPRRVQEILSRIRTRKRRNRATSEGFALRRELTRRRPRELCSFRAPSRGSEWSE